MQPSFSWVSVNFLFLLMPFSFFLVRILLALFCIVVAFLTFVDWAFFVAVLTFFTVALVVCIRIFSNRASRNLLFSLSRLRLRHLRLFCCGIIFSPPIVARFWRMAIFVCQSLFSTANNIIWRMKGICSWMLNTVTLQSGLSTLIRSVHNLIKISRLANLTFYSYGNMISSIPSC